MIAVDPNFDRNIPYDRSVPTFAGRRRFAFPVAKPSLTFATGEIAQLKLPDEATSPIPHSGVFRSNLPMSDQFPVFGVDVEASSKALDAMFAGRLDEPDITNRSIVDVNLEGFGPWNDEFEQALLLINQGNAVDLVRNDPVGIEDAYSVKIEEGVHQREILVDLAESDNAQDDGIIELLLTYFLERDFEVALDHGYCDPDDLLDEPIDGDVYENVDRLIGGITYRVEGREDSEGSTCSVVVFTKES